MSNQDNQDIQHDEIEALSAIYGDEWCVVDDRHRIYCITVTDGKDKPIWKICIQVHMPENYPSDAPPEYQLNAPLLRGEERRTLECMLADVYCENIGESIVYLWVEKIREFLQGKAGEKSIESHAGSVSMVTKTEETEDDDFDYTQWEIESTMSDHSDHSSDMSEDWECPTITHGTPITDRRSTFQPHIASVFHKSQIKLVLNQLYENKKIANATHNIMAYRIISKNNNKIVVQGCDDDGETHAGSRLSHLLQILGVENVMVVVSRWYGGILLGADRFKHINNCARTILQEHGFIKDKIKLVLNQLYENKKISNATHNIMAYRILSKYNNKIVVQGCDDDEETHAGSRLSHLLQILGVENVMVVVSRWYGGILLGADRFKHINNCARTILQDHGYIKDKEDRRSKKYTDKKKR